MAFPIPSHLPRRPNPQDVSSQILSKIDAATNQSLNSTLAASWLAELDQTIQSTKERIHERVQRDLPEFKRQLASSKSVQTRLESLTTNVDSLSESISNPETGLIPTLIGNLSRHAEVAQEATDASVAYDTLFHLLRVKKELKTLESLIEAGKLPEAVEVCRKLETLFQESPAHLNETNVMTDAKRRFGAAQARNEEQLSDAFTRSILVSYNEIIMLSSVQVRQSETVLSLESIMSSLSPSSLANHLTTLRRDLTTHFFDYMLKQNVQVSTPPSIVEHKLLLLPAPPCEPHSKELSARLESLSIVLGHLQRHFFKYLPTSHSTTFTRSLCKPTTTSVLNNLLIPALPSSFDLLPDFLTLVDHAVSFEDADIVGILGNDPHDRPVKAWADGACGHYERQRRTLILGHARDVIIAPEDSTDVFVVEIDILPEATPSVVPVQEDVSPGAVGADGKVKDDAWGFDDDLNSGSAVEADGWGFDDDLEPEPEPEAELEREPESIPEPPPLVQPDDVSSSPSLANGTKGITGEPDAAEAWGWNDEDNVPPAEETAWDDPWADAPSPVSAKPPESPTTNGSRPPPIPSIPPPTLAPPTVSSSHPKAATRLEKAAKKGKKHASHDFSSDKASSDTASPIPSFAFHPSPTPAATTPEPEHPLPSASKRPSRLTVTNVPKETYSVSGRTKRIIRIVEDVLAEGTQFASSKLFRTPSASSSSSATPGSIILLTAPAVLDLHRAIYPVKFGRELRRAEAGMRFANDCAYLGEEVQRIRRGLKGGDAVPVGERLGECVRCFRVLSDSWYHDVVGAQKHAIDKILATGTQGLVYTGDQDRYDECEDAINQALQDIRRLAHKLKGILAKSKYYTAIGMVADAALSRLMADVLALPDIPEVESHRLSELCRIFNAMEGMFVEDPAQPSFVVAYVPSWLKFSYLSELLEASMADITYLFEEGALVDFQVDELVRLVRALFADTPLRTNTINKLLGGHPIPATQ
ncbi:Centromere/kinetochore protein zw10 [Hypsizygus marmoreus]|uniref:Centromere/kinetochore protein zw10 n=1 Tax=Hypsizygus marmoreus TaxID=39966 RepID=A0A369JXQ5_HYPMA|nr:Centromere/kinetochore protein zw10 [Hypsizygus marmoreus]